MLIRRGDEVPVCGAQRGAATYPRWWKNLIAVGEAEAQVGAESWPVSTRVLTDPAERDAAWRLLVAGYSDLVGYQQRTARQLPVAELVRRG